MNPDPLDRKLEAYAKEPMPAVPLEIEAGVWRAIEDRRGATLAARLGWSELLKRPLWAAAGLAFAVAIGAVPAAAFMRAQNAKALARHSLHLEVFSSHTSGQAASVLTPPKTPESSH